MGRDREQLYASTPQVRKSRVNGKQKGAEYERQCAKRLSLWITNGERDDCLWRSALSGGRATLQQRKGKVNKSQTGDLSSIDSCTQAFIDSFLIEIKFYKDLDITSGFVKGKGVLKSFWKKLIADAALARKNPMLIAKQNNLPALMLVHRNGASQLKLGSILIDNSAKVAEFSQWPCHVYLFDELLKTPFTLGAKRERLRQENEG